MKYKVLLNKTLMVAMTTERILALVEYNHFTQQVRIPGHEYEHMSVSLMEDDKVLRYFPSAQEEKFANEQMAELASINPDLHSLINGKPQAVMFPESDLNTYVTISVALGSTAVPQGGDFWRHWEDFSQGGGLEYYAELGKYAKLAARIWKLLYQNKAIEITGVFDYEVVEELGVMIVSMIIHDNYSEYKGKQALFQLTMDFIKSATDKTCPEDVKFQIAEILE